MNGLPNFRPPAPRPPEEADNVTVLPEPEPRPAAGARVGSAVNRSLLVLVGLGCVLVAARTFVPFGSRGLKPLLLDDVYDGAIFASAVLCLLRAFQERRDRWVWLLFATAIAAWGAGDAYASLALRHLAPGTHPAPTVTDAGYLLFYPPACLALLLLFRSRVVRLTASFFLDGAIVTVMLAALTESTVLPVVLGSTRGTSVAMAIDLAHPVADALLLAFALGVVAFGGFRLSADVTVITAALLLFGVTDSIYAYQLAAGSYVTHTVLDLGWLVALALLGAAALTPRRETEPHDAIEGWITMIVPVGVALAALGVLVYDHFRHFGIVPVALAAVVITLALVRLVIGFWENQRLLRRSRSEADTDLLTGLGNRRALLGHAQQLLALEADPARPHVLAIFDLDGFKGYNDTFGHQAGDAFLTRLAKRLQKSVSGDGHVYRLGGDEFCLVAAAANEQEAYALVARASESLTERSGGFVVSSSYGVALFPAEADDVTEALRLADRRMYEQKATRPARLAGPRDALLVALQERDQGLAEHGDDVCRLALAVAHELGLDPNTVESVRTTALLHDIGKLGIPDGILHKRGPLTSEERAYMQTHTVIGERILAATPATAEIARAVRATHERWDGAGYPDRLCGEEIPLPARIVFVCDAYQAMTCDRPHQPASSPVQALSELAANAGGQFDPNIVSVFARVVAREIEATALPAA